MHGPPPTAPKNFVDDVLFLYVANGVTTVRGMQGAPGQLELRERYSAATSSPRLFTWLAPRLVRIRLGRRRDILIYVNRSAVDVVGGLLGIRHAVIETRLQREPERLFAIQRNRIDGSTPPLR